MKAFCLSIVMMMVFTIDTTAATIQDSVKVDVDKVNGIITSLKKKLEPQDYYIFDTGYSSEDITYTYPEKVKKGQHFDIEIRWKDTPIFEYEVDPELYVLTGRMVDLR